MAAPTRARALEYFNYDQQTGELLVRRRDPSEFPKHQYYLKHLHRVGKPAGGLTTHGYVKVCMDGKYYTVHRLAWLIMTGEWVPYPAYELDHINGDRKDNRWVNLRKVTGTENARNNGRRRDNTSGVRGVGQAHDGKWHARIRNNGRLVYIGRYETIHEAKIAREAAEKILGYTSCDREAHRGEPTK